MSDTTAEHLDNFWSLADELLNSVLFLLIGLEVVAIALEGAYLLAGAAAIAIVILARACAVALPIALLKRLSPVTWRAFPIMVWGGLRGAVSVALALSLPGGAMSELIVTVTYVVVIFSVIVQGLTVGKAARRFAKDPEKMEGPAR